MSRIRAAFERARRVNRPALVAYLTGGFPNFRAFERLVEILQEEGVDLVEIGVPFSDPVADGPTIQRASHEALQSGVTLRWLLEWVERCRTAVRVPLVLMTYCNPVMAAPPEVFFRRAARARVDGVLFPDLIPEEGQELERLARAGGLDLIYLAAPTTSPGRLSRIVRRTRGFLYAVSVMGVTGARKNLAPGLPAFLRKLRGMSPVPVAVGFGISRPVHARLVRRWVDGVIVGSALMEIVRQDASPRFPGVRRYIRQMRRALRGGTDAH